MPKVQKNELANVVERAVQDKFDPLKKFDEFSELRELVIFLTLSNTRLMQTIFRSFFIK